MSSVTTNSHNNLQQHHSSQHQHQHHRPSSSRMSLNGKLLSLPEDDRLDIVLRLVRSFIVNRSDRPERMESVKRLLESIQAEVVSQLESVSTSLSILKSQKSMTNTTNSRRLNSNLKVVDSSSGGNPPQRKSVKFDVCPVVYDPLPVHPPPPTSSSSGVKVKRKKKKKIRHQIVSNNQSSSTTSTSSESETEEEEEETENNDENDSDDDQYEDARRSQPSSTDELVVISNTSTNSSSNCEVKKATGQEVLSSTLTSPRIIGKRFKVTPSTILVKPEQNENEKEKEDEGIKKEVEGKEEDSKSKMNSANGHQVVNDEANTSSNIISNSNVSQVVICPKEPSGKNQVPETRKTRRSPTPEKTSITKNEKGEESNEKESNMSRIVQQFERKTQQEQELQRLKDSFSPTSSNHHHHSSHLTTTSLQNPILPQVSLEVSSLVSQQQHQQQQHQQPNHNQLPASVAVVQPTPPDPTLTQETNSNSTTIASSSSTSNNNATTTTKEPDPDKSPDGRFLKFEEIGRGSFKTVYKGLDTETGVDVAWCELKEWLNKNERQRFREEVEMLKNLQHPNIVRFYDFWEVNYPKRKCLVLITELMSSGTLKSYLRKLKKVNTKVFRSWSRQILKGLQFLHSRTPPIIHRDLKCDNVFITGTTGCVKIGDLGLATLKTRSCAKSVIGTPEFMAPEMYEEHYDEAVDVYSFGMCMLEMVTSEYPYSECSGPAQIYKKVTSGIPPGNFARVDDPVVKDIIGRCISVRKEDRPSIKELLSEEFFMEDIGIKIEYVDRDETLANPNDPCIQLWLRIIDPKKRRDKHKENEAVEFTFTIGKDDSTEVAHALFEAGYLMEEDVRTTANLINNQINLVNRERDRKMKAVKEENDKQELLEQEAISRANQASIQSNASDVHQPRSTMTTNIEQELQAIFSHSSVPSSAASCAAVPSTTTNGGGGGGGGLGPPPNGTGLHQPGPPPHVTQSLSTPVHPSILGMADGGPGGGLTTPPVAIGQTPLSRQTSLAQTSSMSTIPVAQNPGLPPATNRIPSPQPQQMQVAETPPIVASTTCPLTTTPSAAAANLSSGSLLPPSSTSITTTTHQVVNNSSSLNPPGGTSSSTANVTTTNSGSTTTTAITTPSSSSTVQQTTQPPQETQPPPTLP